MIKADLHMHSFYSDGTYSIKQILEEARRSQVKILSITDHNCLEAYHFLPEQNEIQIIQGVELDCVEKGVNYHILGYGMELEDQDFQAFVQRNNEKLEQVNLELLKKVIMDHPECSLEKYEAFSYEQNKGGWKLLHYFMKKGLTPSLQEGFGIYAHYRHSYACVDFPSMKEVCKRIHQAHGKAVLAHPQKVLKPISYQKFEQTLRVLLKNGLDGIECYYPSQDEKATKVCLDLCHQHDLIITCGCDCHGEFEQTKIGQLDIPLEKLNLKDLI